MLATISFLLLTVSPKGAERLADLEHLDTAEFDRTLALAVRRHQAQKLVSPTMEIKLGETGEFKSGARIPYAAGGAHEVRFTEAELRMALTPVTTDQGLNLDFDFHWTRPDFSGHTNGDPRTQVMDQKARVTLADGWTVVRVPQSSPPPELLHRPSATATETLWLLFRGALT